MKGGEVEESLEGLIDAIDRRDLAGINSILGSEPKFAKAQWRSDGDTPLHAAVRRETKDALDLLIIQILLAKGAAINAKRTEDGRTPLHEAVFYNYPDLVRLLIAKGADMNARDNGNDTALHIAAGYLEDGSETARILIDSGAQVNAVNGRGWTPLRYAEHHNHYGVRNLLADHGGKM
jgi:ankyrin repeat protein